MNWSVGIMIKTHHAIIAIELFNIWILIQIWLMVHYLVLGCRVQWIGLNGERICYGDLWREEPKEKKIKSVEGAWSPHCPITALKHHSSREHLHGIMGQKQSKSGEIEEKTNSKCLKIHSDENNVFPVDFLHNACEAEHREEGKSVHGSVALFFWN